MMYAKVCGGIGKHTRCAEIPQALGLSIANEAGFCEPAATRCRRQRLLTNAIVPDGIILYLYVVFKKCYKKTDGPCGKIRKGHFLR